MSVMLAPRPVLPKWADGPCGRRTALILEVVDNIASHFCTLARVHGLPKQVSMASSYVTRAISGTPVFNILLESR